MIHTPLARQQVLQSWITNESYQSILDRVLALGRDRQSSYVCVCNVHMTVEGLLNPDFQQIVNNADIVTPDGKPLCFAIEWLYGLSQERVAGPDLMVDILRQAEAEGLSVFFYGGRQIVLDKMEAKLKVEFPNLKIAGMECPPFRDLSDDEKNAYIDQINGSGAHIVFVALGCPKQERWMADHKHKVNAVMLGVGAAFAFYNGMIKRAPKWMQDCALEWLFRWCQEPRYLFKRYFFTNIIFITRFLGQLLKQRLSN